jgi:PAS domain S-box-containing protein
MMTTRESEARKPKPMQCLVAAPEQHRQKALRQFLAENVERQASRVDETACLTEFQQRVAERDYDLVLVALDPSDPNPLGIVENVLRLGQRVPILFLPTSSDARSLETASGRPLPPTEDTNRTTIERLLSGATRLGKADEARSETEDTLRTLYRAIEQAADLVLITDSAGTIEYVNPAFEKLTGYSRSEVVGQTPRILKSGEQGTDVYRELWTTIRAGEIYRGVMVNRKKNGESFIVEKTITPVRNRDGQVAHFISNDRDISERRRLETALFQAQNMDAIGQLAAGVAHDFNNLLMVISSYAELMQDSIGLEHRLHRNVQEVLSASRRAADLTRQLLASGENRSSLCTCSTCMEF